MRERLLVLSEDQNLYSPIREKDPQWSQFENNKDT